MYIPNHNKEDNPEKILSFIKTYPFAALITDDNGKPIATHLPFIVEKTGDHLMLTAHLAKANPHWKLFSAGKQSLVIFSEPHAYVSTNNYEEDDNVPTWNYVAVHVYGKPVILESDEQKIKVLVELIQQSESEYITQFNALDEKYKYGLLNEIVAFQFLAEKIEAKFKLSQNRTVQEQKNVIHSFEQHESTLNQEIARMMKENLEKK